MMHPEFMKILAAEHVNQLRRDARVVRAAPRPVVDTQDVELRLCRVADDPQLDRLAALAERPLPHGRLVLAVTRGQIVAALPVTGGPALRDPFTRTAHLMPLLELRAAQLRDSAPRPWFLPRYVSLMRGSMHA
ncbi:MAG TPA: hypothetical protein VH210_02410 [Gaiellaceae bacterium]|jgi:hypothetical protein|nr:hypothetical protein [Gaiellaceae bacterium]